MQRRIRALACTALISSLAACVVTPPRRASAPPPPPRQASAPLPSSAPLIPPPPRQNQHEAPDPRFGQINDRIDNLGLRIDSRVNGGNYPPPQGNALHHRLDVIREEAHDMAAQHGGSLSGDEQRVLNQELDSAARVIGE